MSITSLSPEETQSFFTLLQKRFEKHPARHTHIPWDLVADRLSKSPEKLAVLYGMEETGGEPDVIGQDASGAIIFCDCAAESPKGRRSLCYDRKALDDRKEFKPANSAVDLANELGIELLDEEGYRMLQTLGEFDLKTSSWIQTPDAIRKLGGAIFADRRYDHVFVYHNGASSYYAARGFRGICKV